MDGKEWNNDEDGEGKGKECDTNDWRFGKGDKKNVSQRSAHRFFEVHNEGEQGRFMFPEVVGAYTVHAKRVRKSKTSKEDTNGRGE